MVSKQTQEQAEEAPTQEQTGEEEELNNSSVTSGPGKTSINENFEKLTDKSFGCIDAIARSKVG